MCEACSNKITGDAMKRGELQPAAGRSGCAVEGRLIGTSGVVQAFCRNLLLVLLAGTAGGCGTPSITAVDLDHPDAPDGIPYYLPKPYLIVAKNVRYIPTPTVGLTQTAPIPDSFQGSGAGDTGTGAAKAGTPGASDTAKPSTGAGASGTPSPAAPAAKGAGSAKAGAQAAVVAPVEAAAAADGGSDAAKKGAAPGDAAAGAGKAAASSDATGTQVLGPASITVVPAASIPDGLTPDVFYTYQIVYLPDLTHRYGLRVKGGSGELRATLDLVNGWMFTGPGPLYLRDSFTSEKITAGGSAASGLLDSASKFASSLAGGTVAAAGKAAAAAGKVGAQAENVSPAALAFQDVAGYAELHVYEPRVVEADGVKTITWVEMKDLKISMSRPTVGLSAGAAQGGAPGKAGAKDTPVVQALQKLSLADGVQGGKFTVSKASFDSTTGQAEVTLASNGKTMGRTYDDASLKARFTQLVCGAVRSVTGSSDCIATIDDTDVRPMLKAPAKKGG